VKLRIVPENLVERIALIFNLAPLPLVDTQVNFNVARTIMAGSNLGIFDSIGNGNKSSAQVIADCHTHPEATRQLLDTLVGIGYLRWKDEKYSVTPRYRKWMLRKNAANVASKLAFQVTEWEWMNRLDDYVRTGVPVDIHGSMNEQEWASYQEGMRDLSVTTATELAKKLKLPAGSSRMLDIGGSHGLFSIELCRRNPGLQSTILELPDAIPQASEIARRNGGDRVKYQAGNALKDDLGENEYDLIMINNVVHHFTEEENRMLAQKIAKALKPRGLYAIGDFMRATRPGEGGVVGSTSGLYFSLTSSSGAWSLKEMQSWQSAAGLQPRKPVTLLTLPGWKMAVAQKS
jgi:2-polyprenyl-3-methyl-5-hydroxy-6-metoxy-1,4-benzoquinol methylase